MAIEICMLLACNASIRKPIAATNAAEICVPCCNRNPRNARDHVYGSVIVAPDAAEKTLNKIPNFSTQDVAKMEPKMSRNFTVYQSRNRDTGTLTRMHDTKHADCPAWLRDGERYIALCVEHKTLKRFASHYEAGRAIAHVGEWCKACQAMIKKGTKYSAEAIASYSTQTLTGNDRFYAYDKRWHDNAKKTTLPRTQDAAGMFNQSAGKVYSARSANVATQRKAKAATKPSAVTTRKAKRSEISKPDPNQLDVIDAKTFRKRTLTSV